MNSLRLNKSLERYIYKHCVPVCIRFCSWQTGKWDFPRQFFLKLKLKLVDSLKSVLEHKKSIILSEVNLKQTSLQRD